MKRTASLLATLAAASAILVFAMASQGVFADTSIIRPLDVTAADIAQAGYTKVLPIAPTATRWLMPVHYFTVNAFISHDDAKRDCSDCGSVVAAYAAVSNAVPGWSINQHTFVSKVAGRYQGRAYLADKKIVIIVTGPNQQLITKLLDQLKAKFSAS